MSSEEGGIRHHPDTLALGDGGRECGRPGAGAAESGEEGEQKVWPKGAGDRGHSEAWAEGVGVCCSSVPRYLGRGEGC